MWIHPNVSKFTSSRQCSRRFLSSIAHFRAFWIAFGEFWSHLSPFGAVLKLFEQSYCVFGVIERPRLEHWGTVTNGWSVIRSIGLNNQGEISRVFSAATDWVRKSAQRTVRKFLGPQVRETCSFFWFYAHFPKEKSSLRKLNSSNFLWGAGKRWSQKVDLGPSQWGNEKWLGKKNYTVWFYRRGRLF